jgi:NADH:ubiquinone oxidoreductase subunit 4 (subunit M)
MTRAIRNILHGPLPEKFATLPDASNIWRKLPYALLLVSLLIFGFVPKLLTDKINPDAQKIIAAANRATPVQPVVHVALPQNFVAQNK